MIKFISCTLFFLITTSVIALPVKSDLLEIVSPPIGMEKKSTDDLIVILQDKRDSWRSAAAQELGKRKSSAVIEPLRNLLKDELPFIKVDAAEALLELGDESGLPVLKEVLTIGTPATALRAAAVLAKHGDNTGLALAKSELSSKYFTNRKRAINALNSSKDEDTAYATLQIGLQDSEHQVRMQSLHLLGKRGTLRSLRMIEPFLSNPDYSERAMALSSVAETRLWDGVPFFLNALADQEPSIRYIAASWLSLYAGQGPTDVSILKAENTPKVERQWREWWEANKSNHPSGTKVEITVNPLK
jgi:HEAT repeat protein